MCGLHSEPTTHRKVTPFEFLALLRMSYGTLAEQVVEPNGSGAVVCKVGVSWARSRLT